MRMLLEKTKRQMKDKMKLNTEGNEKANEPQKYGFIHGESKQSRMVS